MGLPVSFMHMNIITAHGSTKSSGASAVTVNRYRLVDYLRRTKMSVMDVPVEDAPLNPPVHDLLEPRLRTCAPTLARHASATVVRVD